MKIDKSLVDFLLTNNRNYIMVKALVRAIQNMEGQSISLAEGIETKEQAQCLVDLGCEYGQGYYFSKPIPNEEFYEQYVNKV